MKKISVLFLTAILSVFLSCSNGSSNDFVKYALLNNKSENAEMVKVNIILEAQKSRLVMPDIESLLGDISKYQIQITAKNEDGETKTLLYSDGATHSYGYGDIKFEELYVSNAFSKYFGNVTVSVKGYETSIVDDVEIQTLQVIGETSANLNTGKSIVVPMTVVLDDASSKGTIDIFVGFDSVESWKNAGWKSAGEADTVVKATLTSLSATDAAGNPVTYELNKKTDSKTGEAGEAGIWIDESFNINLYVKEAVPGYYRASVIWENCSIEKDGKTVVYEQQPVYFDDNIIVVGANVTAVGTYEPFFNIIEKKFWATSKAVPDDNSGLYPGEPAGIYTLMESIFADYDSETKAYAQPKYKIVCTDFGYLDADTYNLITNRNFGKNLKLELSFDRYSINFTTDETGTALYAEGAIALSGNTAEVNFKPESYMDGGVAKNKITLYLKDGARVEFKPEENVSINVLELKVDDAAFLENYDWYNMPETDDEWNRFFFKGNSKVGLNDAESCKVYVYSTSYPVGYNVKSYTVMLENDATYNRHLYVKMHKANASVKSFAAKLLAKKKDSEDISSGDAIDIETQEYFTVKCVDANDNSSLNVESYKWYVNGKEINAAEAEYGMTIAVPEIKIYSYNKYLNYGGQNVVQCLCKCSNMVIAPTFIFTLPEQEEVETPDTYAFVSTAFEKGMVYGVNSGSINQLPDADEIKRTSLLPDGRVIVEYYKSGFGRSFAIYSLNAYGEIKNEPLFPVFADTSIFSNYDFISNFVCDPVTGIIWCLASYPGEKKSYALGFKEDSTDLRTADYGTDSSNQFNIVVYNNYIMIYMNDTTNNPACEIKHFLIENTASGYILTEKNVKDDEGNDFPYDEEEYKHYYFETFCPGIFSIGASEYVKDAQLVKQGDEYYAYYLIDGKSRGSVARLKATDSGFQMDKEFCNRKIGYSDSLQKYVETPDYVSGSSFISTGTHYISGAATEKERKKYFLGPKNFVAIKDDYLVIFDNGYHVMDGNELKLLRRGRIMTVSLSDYTVSVAKDGIIDQVAGSGTWKSEY